MVSLSLHKLCTFQPQSSSREPCKSLLQAFPQDTSFVVAHIGEAMHKILDLGGGE